MPAVTILNPAHPELGPIAESYGLREAGVQIQVVERGVTLDLSLSFSSGVVGGLDVTVPGRAFPKVILTIETASERRGKLMQLDVEPEVGDSAFDSRVFVDTLIDAAAVRYLFASPEARRAIVWLLGANVSTVKLGPDGICIWLPAEAFAPERFRPYAAALASLAAALPTLPADLPTLRYTGATLLLLLMAVFVAAGIAVMSYALSRYQTLESTPYWIGFVIYAALMPFMAALTQLAVRGRPRSSTAFFAVLMIYGFGASFHGPCDLLFLNCFFDGSRGVAHTFRVLDRSSDEDSVKLTLESWKPSRATVSVRYDDVSYENDRIQLTTHRGLLGWEWTSTTPPPRP
jgi:hypothetical protein